MSLPYLPVNTFSVDLTSELMILTVAPRISIQCSDLYLSAIISVRCQLLAWSLVPLLGNR